MATRKKAAKKKEKKSPALVFREVSPGSRVFMLGIKDCDNKELRANATYDSKGVKITELAIEKEGYYGDGDWNDEYVFSDPKSLRAIANTLLNLADALGL